MAWKIAPWCTDCGNCEQVCPVTAIVRDATTTRLRIVGDRCNACAGMPEVMCQRNCPSEAILFIKSRRTQPI